MPRWIRWIGYGRGAIVVLLLSAATILYAVSNRHLGRTYRFAYSPVPAATDSVELIRGSHLVETIGKCAVCHGDDYGGKVMVDNTAFGRLFAANITGGKGGIPEYTDADYERAIRHGVGREGKPLVFMPADAFAVLSDSDLAAMIGYLRTIPAVDREVPRPRVGPVARALYLAGGLPLLPVTRIQHDAKRQPPRPGVSVAYGEYLATIGGCRGCHGDDLAGTGAPGVPDITQSRLGSWSEADFFKALRQGQRPDGSVIDPETMPWVRSGRMSDDEMRAVWLYIHSRPAVAR